MSFNRCSSAHVDEERRETKQRGGGKKKDRRARGQIKEKEVPQVKKRSGTHGWVERGVFNNHQSCSSSSIVTLCSCLRGHEKGIKLLERRRKREKAKMKRGEGSTPQVASIKKITERERETAKPELSDWLSWLQGEAQIPAGSNPSLNLNLNPALRPGYFRLQLLETLSLLCLKSGWCSVGGQLDQFSSFY